MPKISGVDNLTTKLRSRKQKKSSSVVVGYSQNYAIYVHERLDVNHDVGKAKYLEDPLRNNQDLITNQIKKNFQKHNDLEAAVFTGGLLLQSLSQSEVPVDTGALKSSAFTEKE